MPGLNPNIGGGFNQGPQLKIDFDAQERLTQERISVVSKFGIVGEPLSKLVKKGDKWYIGNQTVEEWDEEWKRLNEKGEDDYKYGRN